MLLPAVSDSVLQTEKPDKPRAGVALNDVVVGINPEPDPRRDIFDWLLCWWIR